VFSGVGGTNTAGGAHNAMSAFEAAIGGIDNGSSPPRSGGHRSVNWDGIPSALADPSFLPGGFYNAGSTRGLDLATPGAGLEVSAGFGAVNATYPTDFPAFSPSRVFSPIGSNVTRLTFYLPGTATHATVAGLGAIFRNVEVANSSSIEYFDRGGQSLGKFFAPTSVTKGDAEFLGVLFNPETAAQVTITTGTTALGPTDSPPGTNVVVLDDIAYPEPQALPSPTLSIGSPADGSTVADPHLTVAGAVSDARGVIALTVNGNEVGVGADGSWSAPLTLSPGPNAVTVEATNVDGNSTRVTRVVTYAPAGPPAPQPQPQRCEVPKLVGKRPAAAERSLRGAHCAVGRILKKRSQGRPGRVVGQKPGAGRELPAGSAVALTVSKR
jgi:hypothetical protein